MTETTVRPYAPETWRALLHEPIITGAAAESALRQMELSRVRNLRAQQPTAERILAATRELGREDLAMRARLILADIAARNGSPIEAAEIVRDVQAAAQEFGDTFVLARSHYVRSWIDYSIGNYPSAQSHAVRSVELLPEGTDAGIMTDHTMMIGIAYAYAPDGQHYFDEALDLARSDGDPVRLMIVHNNSAYAAVQRSDLPAALAHVDAMREVSARKAIPMFAVQYDTIATVYIMAGRYDEAIEILTEVLDRSTTATSSDDVTHLDPSAVPLAMLTMAAAQRHLGRLDRATELLDRATELAAAGNARMLQAKIMHERAQLLAAREDYRSAFTVFTEFYDAMRALEAEEEQARARVVQASFDTERNRRSAEHFRELAMRDALTGLHNRRYLDDLLSAQIATARETGTPLSFAIVDADMFKQINDRLSHDIGDQVLRTLAELFQASRYPTDTICRLGGEEFVLTMPSTDAEEAFRRCETIRRAVDDYDWQQLTGEIPVSVSIGVTTAVAGRTSNSALLADADRNLYAAKRSGRNRVMTDARH